MGPCENPQCSGCAETRCEGYPAQACSTGRILGEHCCCGRLVEHYQSAMCSIKTLSPWVLGKAVTAACTMQCRKSSKSHEACWVQGMTPRGSAGYIMCPRQYRPKGRDTEGSLTTPGSSSLQDECCTECCGSSAAPWEPSSIAGAPAADPQSASYPAGLHAP